MIIAEDILIENNAQLVSYSKDDYIFYEDDKPEFYYQIKEGVVKMSSFSTDGQEFTQGIFKSGQSFGEPALLGFFPFPNNAIAVENCKIYKLHADVFYTILKNNYELHRKFTTILAERLRYKSTLLKEIASYTPDHIIMTLLTYMRNKNNEQLKTPFLIPYTRQQLADMTGLRVETVIRTIKKLHQKGKLQIKEHKIYIS